MHTLNKVCRYFAFVRPENQSFYSKTERFRPKIIDLNFATPFY